jgi:hypothetical protein
MSVGPVVTSGTIDTALSNLAVDAMQLMQQIANLNTLVTSGGNGLAYLESVGYSSAANPDNPGGVSDAQYALDFVGYLNTQAGVYFGTLTQASTFDFHNALAPARGGQLA